MAAHVSSNDTEVLKAEIQELKKTIRDTTSRLKRTERALQESDERVRVTLSAAKAGMWVWGLQETWHTTPTINVLFGRSPGSPPIRLDEFRSLIHPEDVARVTEAWDRTIQTGEPYDQEYRIVWPDGSTRWLGSRGAVVKISSGARQFMGISFDITERKRIEKEVEAAREEYRHTFENTTLGIYRTAPEGRYTLANPAAARLLGYDSPKDLISSVTDIGTQIYVNPEDRDEAFRQIREHGFLKEFEAQFRRKDGSVVWGSLNAVAIRDVRGNILYIQGTSEDITRRKVAEQALRQSEERLRNLTDIISDWAYSLTVRPDGAVIFQWITPAAAKLTGYLPEEIRSISDLERIVHPDDKAVVATRLTRIAAGEHDVAEYRIVTKTGEVRWVRAYTHSVPGSDDSLHVLGAAQDITERRRVEEKLRESGRFLARSQEIAHLGSWAWDIGEDRLQWSDETWRIFGHPLQQFAPCYDDFLRFVHEEDRGKVEKAVKDALAHGDYDVEFRVVREDGTVRWGHSRGEVTFDSNGKPLTMDGTIHDITERKQMEEALRQSEEKYRSLVKYAPAAIYEIDVQGTKFFSVNDGMCNILGYSREELLSMRPADLLDETSRAVFGERIEKKLSGDPIDETNEYRIRRRDGEWIDVVVNVGSRAYSPTESSRIAVVAYDITSRKQAERVLTKARDELEQRVWERTRELNQAVENQARERQRLYNVLETMPAMVCLLAPDYQVPFANRSFREMFGEAGGRPCYEYCFGKNEPCEFCESFMVLKTGGAHHWEVKSPKGRTIDVHDYAFTDADGSPLVLEMDFDITEQRQMEEQLRQSHKMEAVGTLAGGIAHDFNNMLAVIIGNAELALDDTKDDMVRRNLGQILDASKRSRDLVKQILTFSRTSGGQAKAIPVVPLVKETYGLLRASVPTTIEIKLKIRAKSDTVVSGDSSQIQQILINLANNAAHAMRDHGGTLTVGLSSITRRKGSVSSSNTRAGRYVKLTVRDTGTGMSPEIQRRMFDPFFTTKEPGEGTGMGLSVVHGIVQSLGGLIEVESETGKGSTFTVLIPESYPLLVEEHRDEGSATAHGERVLFIDDEPTVVDAAKTTLERMGYDVTTATGAFRALTLFAESPQSFDVVITDQTMPDMTGVELSRKILSARKDIPIILCTGYSETVSAESAKDAGIREFVMKPLTKNELGQAISGALGKREGNNPP